MRDGKSKRTTGESRKTNQCRPFAKMSKQSLHHRFSHTNISKRSEMLLRLLQRTIKWLAFTNVRFTFDIFIFSGFISDRLMVTRDGCYSFLNLTIAVQKTSCRLNTQLLSLILHLNKLDGNTFSRN